MNSFGFDRLLYGFTRRPSTKSLVVHSDWSVLTNHPAGYMKSLLENDMVFSAPMMKWVFENDGACSWSLVRSRANAGDLSNKEEHVIGLNKAWDIRAGYTVSFQSGSARTKAAISLTSRPGLNQDDVDAIWDEHGDVLLVANYMFHFKRLTLPYSDFPALTARQIEVLEWVGDGKAVQDIAILMGLKAATIDKHLRLARETLQVDTTAQAVLKAMFYNQTFQS